MKDHLIIRVELPDGTDHHGICVMLGDEPLPIVEATFEPGGPEAPISE